MTRDEAQEKYRWDLTSLFASDEEYDIKLKQLIKDAKELKYYKGKLTNPDKYLEFLNKKEDISNKLDLHYNYSYLKATEDTSNKKYEEMELFIESVYDEINDYYSFENKAVAKFSEKYLDRISKDERFNKYHDSIFVSYMSQYATSNRKQYKLDNILIDHSNKQINFAKNNFTRITTNGPSFQPILDANGNRHIINDEFLNNFSNENDKVLLNNFTNEYKRARSEMNNQLTYNYYTYINAENVLAEMSGYKSVLERKLDEASIDKKVFDNLLTSTRNNLPLFHKYLDLDNEILKYKKAEELKYSYEDSFKIVLKAMKVFGKEYLDILMRSYNERWIDVYPAKHKRPGAFKLGSYLKHPFIELNHEDKPANLYTLAHELGHAVHSELSRKSQSSLKYAASSFLSEIASTTNEVILNMYQLKNARSTVEKLEAMQNYLDNVYTHLYSQVFYTDFELQVNKLIKSGEQFTAPVINGLYYSTWKKYFNSDEKPSENNALFWDTVSHFYRSFYCYTYATGFITASILADKIIESKEFAQKYLEMLQKGSSEEPLKMLKELGVDLTKEDTFKTFFKKYKDMLDECNKLLDTHIAENIAENDNSVVEFSVTENFVNKYLLQKKQKENPDKKITEKDISKEPIDQSVLDSKEFIDYVINDSINDLNKSLEEKSKNKSCEPKELDSIKNKINFYNTLKKSNHQTDNINEIDVSVNIENTDKNSANEFQQDSQINLEN